MRLIVPFAVLLIVFIASILLDAPQPRAELVANIQAADSLDPQMTHWSHDIRFGYAIYEGLCTYNPFTYEILPGVAERWEISEDGKTYTFHLRDDAKWSNGDAVTAHDFAFAWRIGLMPENTGTYAEFFYFFEGAKTFNEWAKSQLERIKNDESLNDEQRLEAARQRIDDSYKKFQDLVGVRVVDDHTLIVKLNNPTPYFLDLVAFPTLFPLHRPTRLRFSTEPDPDEPGERRWSIDGTSYMLRTDAKWTKPPDLIGNGPYRLERWRFRRDRYLVANDHYWNPQIVKSKTVRFINFEEVNHAAWAAYDTGTLDVLFDAEALRFAAEVIAARKRGERTDVNTASRFGTYYFAFNCRPALPSGAPNPFADARVRRAFAMAVDKQTLVEDVTRLNQTPADVFIPPGSIVGYESPGGLPDLSTGDPTTRAQTLTRARQLLAEAGYPEGRGFPAVDLGYNTGGGHELIAQAIGNSWSQYLGVTINLRGMETRVYGERQKKGEFMISRLGWIGDYGDPTTFLDLFRADSGNNPSGYDDPAYERLLDEAKITADPAQRMDLLEAAEQRIMQETLPVVPLYHYNSLIMYDPKRVTGVTSHPRLLHMYHYIEVKSP